MYLHEMFEGGREKFLRLREQRLDGKECYPTSGSLDEYGHGG
jgi:hypothetical protein